jgi:hypothetical protein
MTQFKFLVVPMIKVGNQHLRAAVGQNITLTCEVEAFPEALRYWKKDNTQLLQTDYKYTMAAIDDPNSRYKVFWTIIV